MRGPSRPDALRFGDEDEAAAAAIPLLLERRTGGDEVVGELVRRSGFPLDEHFANDDELLTRAYEVTFVAAAGEALQRLHGPATTWERLERDLEASLPRPGDRAELLTRLLGETVLRAVTSDQLARDNTENYAMYIEHFADLVADGQRDATMRADLDAEQAAWLLCGVLDGLSLQLVARSTALTREDAVALVLEAAHRLLDPA